MVAADMSIDSQPLTTGSWLLVGYIGSWYGSASLSNNASKLLLEQYPHPLTVALLELVVAVFLMVLGKPTAAARTVRRLGHIWHWGVVLGAATLSCLVLHRVSLLYLHVSYVHTIKALQPLFAVTISRLWLKEPVSRTTLPALALIFCGVGLASAAEAEFNWLGALAALGSTACLATNIVLSKHAITQLQLDTTMMVALVKGFSLVLLIPVWLAKDFPLLQLDFGAVNPQFLGLLALHCGAMTVQSLASITVLASISPVSHAVANSFKRIFVIVLALLYFQNPVGPWTLIGVCMATFGVHQYSVDRQNLKQQTLALP